MNVKTRHTTEGVNAEGKERVLKGRQNPNLSMSALLQVKTRSGTVHWNHARFGVRGVSKRTGSNTGHGPSWGNIKASRGKGNTQTYFATRTGKREDL
ncbi:hypothetical protein E2C01_056271 [Portunus trituberculatus]|uniref:Uncharacterized protein n=1 Tax=Portunus trituberculatus TaxID=210409 RepID=A0A5B7GZ57_PORTR|nr:hypothetical protein [Portunus trituberculatus]